MLIKVSLGHIVVNFSSFVRCDVGGWIGSLVDKFRKQRIDLAMDGLAIQCVLHYAYNLRI